MAGKHVAVFIDGKYSGWTHIDKIMDRLFEGWSWVDGTYREVTGGWFHDFVDGHGREHSLEVLDI